MIPQLPVEWLAPKYQEDDHHKLVDVARSERGISTLHEVTGGDLSRSRGWEMFIKPYGGEQQLLLALRTRTKEVRGVLAVGPRLLRDRASRSAPRARLRTRRAPERPASLACGEARLARGCR